ncbi:MAG: Mercuric ion reductase [uncultured Solirubrobacteraceae bacterium]|uniref:Mercuric ion reductase n=1 Tax=uncultured Solirubrobacteraceae bacterium TaxID=1162706 RepID=A0A6J4S975_9ACTN|nr:MAG: Mercuric ion reductase [uncultured Solirubrobacteraceae bacterium]
MSRHEFDLVVLGGGTGGLVSALVAAGIGARVALVERARTGGDCLWTGCVPSKSLISAARLAHRMRHAGNVGLAAVEPDVDFQRVMSHVYEAISAIAPHDSPERLRGEGVDVIEGEGRFLDPHTLEVAGRRISFRSAIVATGSEPTTATIPGAGSADVLTTDSFWSLTERPARLLVLGGGPIGCELGQAMRRLGSEVVLVEFADRLLGKEEPEAGALIAARLSAEGVDVRLGTKAVEVRRPPGGRAELVVERPDGERETIAFDRLLAATGRTPRTSGIGLEDAGVATEASGAVIVDETLKTTSRNIFAVGDVTARLPFTHVAAHHARVATVNALLGARRTVDETIPWVTFTDPEVARVGLTQAEARKRWGARAVIARSDYESLDRAVTEGEGYGFALLVGDPRGRLVGATVAAPAGGEAIAELSARIAAGDRIGSVSSAVHAYPTFAEGPSRAADDHLRRHYGKRRYRLAARIALAARDRLVRD